MSENVIRQDIIKIVFESNTKVLDQLVSELDSFKKSVNGDVDKGLKKMKSSVDELGKSGGVDKITKDVNKLTQQTDRFTSKFQSVNRSIQDGEYAIQKLKSSIKNLPSKTFDKISTELNYMELKADLAVKSFKNMAKLKLNNIVSDFKATKTAITEGEKGLKGFKNALANITKIKIAKIASTFENIKGKIIKSQTSVKNFTSNLKENAKVSFTKLTNSLSKVSSKLSEVANKAAGAAYRGLKKMASVSFKGLVASAGAVSGVIAASVNAYADTEQLIGGVETIFKENASTVQKYANDAYKAAGLSANEYMETVTGFSASLIQSLGGDTKKAAEYANMAISDMADNANKYGSDIGSIQNAYQGFSKQNYTMLDNLKLGLK